MGFIIRVLVTAVAAYLAANILSGVTIEDVSTAIIVALVLALLNSFIRPILIVLTIPVTIATLGLFLLIINALMVKWAAALVDGFEVDNWWSALLFSLIVSFVSYIINSIISKDRKREQS
jgi:putative membrane protein